MSGQDDWFTLFACPVVKKGRREPVDYQTGNIPLTPLRRRAFFTRGGEQIRLQIQNVV